MEISIQTDSLELLNEAVESECDSVRFGSEFCEITLPSFESLKEAFKIVKKVDKPLSYVIPRIPDSYLDKIRSQLIFLDNKENCNIVVNDFGILNIMEQYSNLTVQLGRQLLYLPARCPWLEETITATLGFFQRRRLKGIYYMTSLNFSPTIDFFKKLGVKAIDVDWIPNSFTNYEALRKKGFKVSVHSHLIPVAVTRACHSARFLDEEDPENCSKKCYDKAFLLKPEVLGLEFYLHGNTVYSFVKTSRKDVRSLIKNEINEIVVSANPVTEIHGKKEINDFIKKIKS
jgi:hypothetical protein